MTRKDDLEQRLDDLEDALDPAHREIVIVDKDGVATAGGKVVEAGTVHPSLVVHMTAQERTVIDPETLEIVGTEPIEDEDDGVDGGDS